MGVLADAGWLYGMIFRGKLGGFCQMENQPATVPNNEQPIDTRAAMDGSLSGQCQH
jgi:hypothetical protein